MNPGILYAICAAIPAVWAEYLYRTWDPSRPWISGLWMWLPLQLSIGYFIFRLVSMPHTTLLDAFVVWALATTGLRVLVSCVILGETVRTGTWIALGLLFLAKLAQTFWGR